MSDESGVAAVFPTRIEAEIARARLEALGIAAWIDADDAGGLYPQFQIRGVRLRVSAADKAAAERILGSPEPESEEIRGDLDAAERALRDESPLEAKRPRFSAVGVLVALLTLAALGLAWFKGAE
jgi:hypothetical protein